jgi:hypothetical protein
MVIVYVDLWGLVFKPFDSDGLESNITFALKRVSNFTSLAGGRKWLR